MPRGERSDFFSCLFERLRALLLERPSEIKRANHVRSEKQSVRVCSVPGRGLGDFVAHRISYDFRFLSSRLVFCSFLFALSSRAIRSIRHAAPDAHFESLKGRRKTLCLTSLRNPSDESLGWGATRPTPHTMGARRDRTGHKLRRKGENGMEFRTRLPRGPPEPPETT